MLKSQKSIIDKIDSHNMSLPYPNNLLMELGVAISNRPVSAEFTSNLMQTIDNAFKNQEMPFSEILMLRYGKNMTFEKIEKATGKSVGLSLPKKIGQLKANESFMQEVTEMYEIELNPEKAFLKEKEKAAEIPSKPLPSKHVIAEQQFKSPVPKSDNPSIPKYPNNLLEEIGIHSEKPLSKAFEKRLWETIQRTNISDRNKDVLMQYIINFFHMSFVCISAVGTATCFFDFADTFNCSFASACLSTRIWQIHYFFVNCFEIFVCSIVI